MPHAKKTITMKQPHDNWATFYDFVYGRTFGNLYNDLTTKTLNVINSILTNGIIIDYGAGTGRLTIPLRDQDYEIVAVEKSSGMVGELIKKRTNLSLDFQIHNCLISEYANGNCDFALALFTVLSYATTENELSENVKNICNHLKENGYFFFDLPNAVFFNTERLINIQSNEFNRSVNLKANNNDDVYTYSEKCSGVFNGKEFDYEDEFSIRNWKLDKLDQLLQENGLHDTNQTFHQFNSTGSTYKLYQKK
jgi:SAM-dependent methyltransferase